MNTRFTKAFIALLALVSVMSIMDFGPDACGMTLCAATFSPLLYQQGQNNMGGYQNWAVYIPLSILSSMPELPSTQTDDDDYVVATGSFVFKTGEQPVFIYATEETVKYSAESAGERDGKSFEQKVEFFFPGNKKEAHALATRIKNQPGIILIADSDGRQQIIGSRFIPAYLSPSFDGGQKRADLRGLKFEGGAASNQSAVFLETPLIVDPLTGSVTYASDDEEEDED